MRRTMQRSPTITTVRIHIRASSNVLFNSFDVSVGGSIVRTHDRHPNHVALLRAVEREVDVPVDVVLNRVPRTSAETNGYYQCYSSRAQKQTAGPGPEIPSDVPPSDVPRTWPGSTEDAWSGRGSEQTGAEAECQAQRDQDVEHWLVRRQRHGVVCTSFAFMRASSREVSGERDERCS